MTRRAPSARLPRGWIAAHALVVAALCAVGAWRASAGPDDQAGDVERGRALYVTGCASCHGLDGMGVPTRGPTLQDVGAASADFSLSSGRMPASNGTDQQALRKPPAYSPEEIRDLVAYVATFGDGPPIPEVDVSAGDLAMGQQLYTANCAGCHNSAGSGGSLGQGVFAPPVTRATPLQVAEAIRVGPGAMPAFGTGVIDEGDLASVVRYVDELREPRDEGGLALGRIGPVTEGLVAWLVGMVALVAIARLVGARR